MAIYEYSTGNYTFKLSMHTHNYKNKITDFSLLNQKELHTGHRCAVFPCFVHKKEQGFP